MWTVLPHFPWTASPVGLTKYFCKKKKRNIVFRVATYVIAKHQSLEINLAAINRACPQLLPYPCQLRIDEPDALRTTQDPWEHSKGILLVGKREGRVTGSRFSPLPGQGKPEVSSGLSKELWVVAGVLARLLIVTHRETDQNRGGREIITQDREAGAPR